MIKTAWDKDHLNLKEKNLFKEKDED